MTEPTARQRRSDQRRRHILDAARERADAEGWAAVTTRHLADAAAVAYLDFAAAHPAVHEAMFDQPIDTRFASEDTEPELRAGFAALADAVGDGGDGIRTEVFWGARQASANSNAPDACVQKTAHDASQNSAPSSAGTPPQPRWPKCATSRVDPLQYVFLEARAVRADLRHGPASMDLRGLKQG